MSTSVSICEDSLTATAGPRSLNPPATGVATNLIMSTPPMTTSTAQTPSPTITFQSAGRFNGETAKGAVVSLTRILILLGDRGS
jgi:hypothetical protein